MLLLHPLKTKISMGKIPLWREIVAHALRDSRHTYLISKKPPGNNARPVTAESSKIDGVSETLSHHSACRKSIRADTVHGFTPRGFGPRHIEPAPYVSASVQTSPCTLSHLDVSHVAILPSRRGPRKKHNTLPLREAPTMPINICTALRPVPLDLLWPHS